MPENKLEFVEDTVSQQEEPQTEGVEFVEDTIQAEADAEQQQIEEYAKEAAVNSVASIIPGASPGLIDKAARIATGTIDFIKNAVVDAPKAISYMIASNLFDDEEIDSPEERKALMMAVNNVYDTVNPASPVIEKLANEANEALEIGIDHHEGKDFLELAEEGDYLDAADAFAGDIASALPSVGAAFLGPGGLALIGGSVFGSKFTEQLESDTDAATWRMGLNAASSAGGEILSEAFTAGLGGGLTKLATKLGPKAAKAILRNTGSKLAFGFTGEGLSEVAADAWDRAGDMALLGDDEAFEGAMREFGKTFLIGGAIGGGITISQLSNKAEPGAVDAVREAATPPIIKESRKKSAAVINALQTDLQDAQEVGDQFLIEEIEAEIKAERAKLKRSQESTEKHLTEHSAEQVKDLVDEGLKIDDYNRRLEDSELTDAADALLRKHKDEAIEKQEQIFDNPDGLDIAKAQPVSKKNQELSAKVQTAVEAGDVHTAVQNLGGAITSKVQNYYNGLPQNVKDQVSLQDVISEATHGPRGVRKALEGWDPKRTAVAAKHGLGVLNKRLPEFVDKLTDKVQKQKLGTYDAQDTAAPVEVDLANLNIPQEAVVQSKRLAEQFDIKLDGIKSPKDYVKQQREHFRKFLLPKLKQSRKEYRKFVKNNVETLRDLVANSDLSRNQALRHWNATPPTIREFADHFLGNDLDTTAKSYTKSMASRIDAMRRQIADALGQKAWNDYVAANPAVQQRVNELNQATAIRISENIKEGSSTDFAFQENTEPADTDFAAQSEITNKVLEKHGQKRLPDSRDPQQYEEMRNWVGDVMSQYFPRSFFTSGGFWNAGNSAAKRGFFYTNATDFEVANEGVTFTEGYDYSKATRFQYKNKTIENLLKSKDKLAQVNKNNQEAFNEMWKTFDKMIKADPKNARMIAAFLKSAQNSQNHLSRTGAPIVAYSKTGPYTEEHAMPQSAVSRYLMNTILEGGDINSALKNTNRNFVQVALNHVDDASLKQNKIGPNGSNLNANMPAGWKPSDNWLARYFNSTSNIDPDSIVFIESGKTVTQTYAPRISESIRGIGLGQAYRRREQQKIADQTLEAFDFDDTLFKSDSKIVVKNKGVETTLTPEEFSTYKKKADDVFDFGQFNEVINPVALPTLNKMKDAIAAGNNVTILTARHPKAGPAVNETLKQFGIDPTKVKFRGVQSSNPQAKANYIKNAINKYGFKNVFFADDAIQNTDAVAKVIAELGVEGNVETPRISENIRLTALGQAQKRRQQQAPKPPKGDFDAPNRPGGKSEFGKRAGAEFRFSEYIDEARIPEVTDQIKAQYDGQILHNRARNLAIEQLRREANYGQDLVNEHIKRQAVADQVADQTNRKIDSALAQKYDFAQLEAESFDAADNVNGIINILNQGWRGQGIESTSDPVYAHAYVVNELGISPAYANKVLARSNGFAAGNLVYVAKSGNKEVALHEYGHIWNHMMQDRNPNTFNAIFDKIQNEAPEVFQQQIDRINSRSYDLKEGSPEWKDEIMAGIIGYHGNAKIKSNSKALNDIIKEYWNSIKKMLGFDYAGKDIADLNVEQVLDLVVDEVVSGKVGNNVLMLNLTKPSLARRGLAFSLKGDPEVDGLNAVKKAYRESKDLPSAIQAGYEAVKGKYEFDSWAEFANKAIGEVKIGDTTTLSIAKGKYLAQQEISLQRIQAAKDAQAKLRKENSDEQLRSKFKKVLADGSNRRPSSWFINPQAEDFQGLLDALLPKGRANAKQGVENQKFLKETLIDPYNSARNAIDSDTVAFIKKWEGVDKGKEFKKEVGGGYTVGDAIQVHLAVEAGLDTGITDKALVERLQAKGSQYGDVIEVIKQEGFEVSKESIGTPLGKILMDNANKASRDAHLATFKQNVDLLFTPEVLKGLESTKGEKYVEALKGTLQRLKTGRNRTGTDAPANSVLKWVNRAVGTTMFFNTRSAMLQMLSTMNYMGKPGNSVPKTLKNWSNIPQMKADIKKLMNTGYMQDRMKGAKFDLLADQLSQGESNIDKLLKFGFSLTKAGDAGAILLGGAAYYRSLLDSGLSEQDALTKWIEATEESQQSADPSKISQLQSSAAGKVLFAFSNTPFQYARIVKKRLGELSSGRSAVKGNVQADLGAAAYYAVGQAALFSGLQSGLFAYLAFADDDDETKERTLNAIEGQLTSFIKTFGLHGAVAGGLWETLQAVYEGKRGGDVILSATSISPPINSKLRDLKRTIDAGKKAYKNEDWQQGLVAAGDGTAFATGVPLDRVLKKVDNLATWANEEAELWQKIMRTLGWSDWDVGGGNVVLPEYKGKKKKSDLGLDLDLDLDLDLELSPLNRETGQAFNDGTIEVDPNLSPLEREKTIKHEMQHVRDMEENGLDYDDNNVYFKGKTHARKNGMIEYNGKMYKEGARELPWERRAYDAESPLKRDGKTGTSSDTVNLGDEMRANHEDIGGRVLDNGDLLMTDSLLNNVINPVGKLGKRIIDMTTKGANTLLGKGGYALMGYLTARKASDDGFDLEEVLDNFGGEGVSLEKFMKDGGEKWLNKVPKEALENYINELPKRKQEVREKRKDIWK